jgi:predicted O-methyltransferase YrrM
MVGMNLPTKDYVSPGFAQVTPDAHFPHMVVGDPAQCRWPYLRRTGQHNWYVDGRAPTVGFLSRDEAHILYNTALKFRGRPALEIGCWLGWSACHLALADVRLDVIDPLLKRDDIRQSVTQSLGSAGVLDRVRLVPGSSPHEVHRLGAAGSRWSLIFIDGDHESPGPLTDAVACEQYCTDDAVILFHDLLAPAVADGLRHYKERGWRTRLFRTSQIMGAAWRGTVEPIGYTPDAAAHWEIPPHLDDLD